MSDPIANYQARREATLPAPAAHNQRETPVVRTNSEQHLLCPRCGDEWTHVEDVHVSARVEDRQFNEITVNALTGAVRTQAPTVGPKGAAVKEGRRHRIALKGFCETCGDHFALIFTQHKGVTIVEWEPMS